MRGIHELREWEEDDHDVRRDAETVPAPPRSDIRMIGQLIAETIAAPPPTIPPPPRMPRETVIMTMRPRQVTLVMPERPAPPRPFESFMPVIAGAFFVGLFVAALVAIVLIRL